MTIEELLLMSEKEMNDIANEPYTRKGKPIKEAQKSKLSKSLQIYWRSEKAQIRRELIKKHKKIGF